MSKKNLTGGEKEEAAAVAPGVVAPHGRGSVRRERADPSSGGGQEQERDLQVVSRMAARGGKGQASQVTDYFPSEGKAVSRPCNVLITSYDVELFFFMFLYYMSFRQVNRWE